MSRDCPVCQKVLTRIRRKRWMHHIPGSKHYRCRECGNAYLLIFNLWLWKRRQSPKKADSQGS
jgi:predicted SprT family Zn-dependent metalloprotease